MLLFGGVPCQTNAMAIASINPATGETLQTFDALSAQELDAKIHRAFDAFHLHRRTSFEDRCTRMLRAAEILTAEKERIARIMTLEMGKPIKSAGDEVLKCAWACRYYAEGAENMLADEVVKTNASRSFVRFQPLGVVLAVMPWNFPFWQVFRFAAPALMAGKYGSAKTFVQRSAVRARH